MIPIFNKVTAVTQPIYMSDIEFAYRGTPVFESLTLSIPPAAITAVVGSNGSGKSTLLGLLAGIHRPAAGEINPGVGSAAIAVQRSAVTDSFPITTAEAVMMGRWRHLGLFRRPRRRDRDVVDHWLAEFGLDQLRHRTLGELSGGQCQRVLLAQAFAQEAPVLLLDEPTTGLDAASRTTVIGHLRRVADAGTTVVAATHDRAVTAAADSRIDLDRPDRH